MSIRPRGGRRERGKSVNRAANWQVGLNRSRRGRLALACALALSGCGVQGLNFVQDTRLEIVAPLERSQVTLPVTIAWEYRDFEATGPTERPSDDAGHFGVFVNRAPQPPGEPLEWLARDDASCGVEQGCPDDDWYARHGIFTTENTSFTVERVQRPAGDRREFHSVTIVFLDGWGRRIGESAFAVQFEVVRSR